MKDSIIKLNQFIVDNNALEILEAMQRSFNPFKVLKLDTYEIRHSNILAWLLDPSENHNLGYKFLKKILGEIIVRNDNISINKPAIDIVSASFNDVEVFREKNNIDILVISEKNEIALAIENKIYSGEHDNQLNRYYDKLKEIYQNIDIVPVYLTLTGEKPTSSNEWGSLSYEIIYKVLNSVIELYKDTINNKVYDFILYYLDILEELTMQDDDVIELCKKIYRKHKDAVDLIVKYGISSSFSKAASSFLEDNINVINLGSNNSMFTFIPKEFLDATPLTNVKENNLDSYPIEFYFQKNDDRLDLILEVQPFDSIDKRIEFLTYLKNEGNFKILDKSLTEGSKYTRLFSKNCKIKDWDDETEILNAMNQLFREKANDVRKEIIDSVISFSRYYDKFVWQEGDLVILEDEDK